LRLLHELRGELAAFLGDPEHGVCVLRGAREQLPFVYRLLHEFAASSADVFLSFPHRFVSAAAYVEVIGERIAASERAARGAAPALVHGHAALRLKAALERARELLPRGRDTPRLVVVLCPLEIVDERAYVALTRGLIEPGSGAPPWFRRMRVFVHATAAEPSPLPRFVRALPYDLSSEALARSAATQAEDPSVPRPQRAQALLQAAMLDVGHRRFEPAQRRLDALYDEAQALESPVLAALALSGLGDIERIEKRGAAAIEWYERALVPASDAGAPIVLLMITRHLADLYFAGGRVADAEVFFDGAQQLARMIPEPETQATSLLGRGLAQQRRGAAPEVWAASFLAAAEVARDNDRDQLVAELRPHLQASRCHGLPAALRRSIDTVLGGGHGLERR
jgi:tetratricopeptide (TPR) repeat protein